MAKKKVKGDPKPVAYENKSGRFSLLNGVLKNEKGKRVSAQSINQDGGQLKRVKGEDNG